MRANRLTKALVTRAELLATRFHRTIRPRCPGPRALHPRKLWGFQITEGGTANGLSILQCTIAKWRSPL